MLKIGLLTIEPPLKIVIRLSAENNKVSIKTVILLVILYNFIKINENQRLIGCLNIIYVLS